MDLSDKIARAEVVANAHAFYVLKTAAHLGYSMGEPELLREYLNWRLPRAQVEKVFEPRGKGAIGADAFDSNLTAPTPWRQAWFDLAKGFSAIDRCGISTAPINTLISLTTASATFDWVARGAPAPVSKMTTATASLPPFKIAGIRTATKELVLHSEGAATAMIERDSQRAVGIATDRCAFTVQAASANVRPDSLTYNATNISSSGTTGEAVLTDIMNCLLAISDGCPQDPRLVINPRGRTFLSALRTTGNVPAFPDLPRGEILGVPVVVGLGVPDYVIALDAAGIVLADGGIEVALTTQANVEMVAPPTQSGVTPTAAQMVSTYQASLLAVKSERYLNWMRRSNAVAYRSLAVGGSPL